MTDKVFEQIDTNFYNKLATIKKLETQIGQITQQLAELPRGALPSNTLSNPKERVQAMKTRSGIHVPEINVKRLERKEKKMR